MTRLEKFQTLVVFIGVLFGLLLGQFSFIEANAQHFVIPFLMVMLYGLFLNVPLKDIGNSFKNFRFAIVVIIMNFVWTPILVWFLGGAFLREHPALWIGYIMLLVTPCTDWFLVFTGIAKGNVPLSTSILPVNLVLQVVLLPVYLFIFAGVNQTIDIYNLINSIFFILVIPFTLAQATKVLFSRIYRNNAVRDSFFGFFSSAQSIMLALAVTAMFAYQGRNLLANLDLVYLLLVPILIFYAITVVIARVVSRALKFSYEDYASLTMTAVAKNSPMTLGIAVIAFPNEPIIALAMIIEPLVELPCMMLISQVLLLIRKRDLKRLNSRN